MRGPQGSAMATTLETCVNRQARQAVPWLVPSLILVAWQALSLAGLIPARVLPARWPWPAPAGSC